MSLKSILEKFKGAKRVGTGWVALCPAHADRRPSLSVTEREGKILLKCHAGCEFEAILEAAGLVPTDLFARTSQKQCRPRKSRKKVVATYDYVDAAGMIRYQKVRYEPKTFSLRRPDGRGGWIENLDGVERVLYRLPEVLVATDVLIFEGEKDVESARQLGVCATTGGSASDPWLMQFTECLRGRNIFVIADSDGPGRKKASVIAAALHGTATSVRLGEMPNAKDLTEWVERGGTKPSLMSFIQGLGAWQPPRLDGSTLLDEVFRYIRRFVSLSEYQARVAAVWVIHTQAFPVADATPYLAITSAEKQSGKSRLLEVLQTLVANPWLTGRVTAAVLVRKIDAEQPTLLLDESDAAFGGEKEYAETLRGVLNTGHRREGKYSCCVGQGPGISFRDFCTFSPKAIAGIGKLPDTVADRAIPIRLKRAAPGESIERFRKRNVEVEASSLQGRIEAWSASIAEKLRDARPDLPEELTDRQQDGAEPLLAIADAAGGEWPNMVRQALVGLCAEAQASDDSNGRKLLADIHGIFQSRGTDRLSSAELAGLLAEIETSPWGEWANGKPLTAPRLARLLKPYGISPECIRIGDKTPRGYLLEQFEDSFRRYLRLGNHSPAANESPQSATTQQPTAKAVSGDFSMRNTETRVVGQECTERNENADCCIVAISEAVANAKGIEEAL